MTIQNPISVAATKGAATWADISRLNRVDWADRRSVQSAIETGIHAAEKLSVIDPKRIGIAGLSDGASSVQFALVNSHLFSAAAMSSCCEDEPAGAWLDGPAVTGWLHDMGYPSLSKPDAAFWADMSVRQNAARLKVPLLIQTPDREYLGALEGVTALKEYGQPVELYVFPDENHVKWQPVHREAVYERGVDWFSFWLNGQEDADPAKKSQYERWRAMRATQPVSSAAPGR